MLIITGMGRSGTSFLTKFLYDCGVNVGAKRYISDINAGFEYDKSVKINSQILDDTDIGVEDQIKSIDLEVFKDPRFTFPSVMKKWIETRDDLSFLMLLRDPKHAIESRHAHPNHFTEVETVESLTQRVLETYLLLGQYNIPHETITFPHFLEQFEEVYDKLIYFGGLELDYNICKKKWDKLVDFNKVHFK